MPTALDPVPTAEQLPTPAEIRTATLAVMTDPTMSRSRKLRTIRGLEKLDRECRKARRLAAEIEAGLREWMETQAREGPRDRLEDVQ